MLLAKWVPREAWKLWHEIKGNLQIACDVTIGLQGSMFLNPWRDLDQGYMNLSTEGFPHMDSKDSMPVIW